MGRVYVGLRDVSERVRDPERPQLLEALVLDLPDPLARHVERSPDLVERARLLAAEPVAKLEHPPLPVRERAEDVAQQLLAQSRVGRLVGQRSVLVGEEVPELRLLLVPDRLLERHRHLRRAPDRVDLVDRHAELGREPTAREIAADLDLTAEEVEQIRRSSQTPVSLEKPVGDEEESEFGHFITDESVPLPDEAAETALRRETLEKLLHKLSVREREVLILRYGLDGKHPRTLDEVGRTFNVTRERIRQIENQTLKKLRALADAQILRDVA